MRVLTINTGSSSVKAGLYEIDSIEKVVFLARMERIGLPGGRIRIENGAGETVVDRSADLPEHDTALRDLLEWMRLNGFGAELDAVGHRVVHGGKEYVEPQLISDELVAAVQRCVSMSPMHLPQAIAAIETLGRAFPTVPQVACFDTSFHRNMPRVAQTYALPSRFADMGIIRYGFHGLSYEYIMQQLSHIDRHAAEGRVIVAHLGNGASMAAVRGGHAIDTTMGFTPTSGMLMGTRSGDIDPGVLIYLLEDLGMTTGEVKTLVNRHGGLLGVSGISADMLDLLMRESADSRAALAVELFCYQARKVVGAMAAALGGLETLVFTGGIGERGPSVRERICANLGFLGVRLDPTSNRQNAQVISAEDSRATVRVIATDEDLMIARHTARLIPDRRQAQS